MSNISSKIIFGVNIWYISFDWILILFKKVQEKGMYLACSPHLTTKAYEDLNAQLLPVEMIID
jgi:hypothetical protein